jgi:hypothetical protein
MANDRHLTHAECAVFSFLEVMSHKTGYCYASNEILAERFDVSISTIERRIRKLAKHQYITVSIKNERYDSDTGKLRWKTKRKIYISGLHKVVNNLDSYELKKFADTSNLMGSTGPVKNDGLMKMQGSPKGQKEQLLNVPVKKQDCSQISVHKPEVQKLVHEIANAVNAEEAPHPPEWLLGLLFKDKSSTDEEVFENAKGIMKRAHQKGYDINGLQHQLENNPKIQNMTSYILSLININAVGNRPKKGSHGEKKECVQHYQKIKIDDDPPARWEVSDDDVRLVTNLMTLYDDDVAKRHKGLAAAIEKYEKLKVNDPQTRWIVLPRNIDSSEELITVDWAIEKKHLGILYLADFLIQQVDPSQKRNQTQNDLNSIINTPRFVLYANDDPNQRPRLVDAANRPLNANSNAVQDIRSLDPTLDASDPIQETKCS